VTENGSFYTQRCVIDNFGRMFICDWGNERIRVLKADGQFLQMTLGQSGLSPWAANFLNINVEEGQARERSDLHNKISSLRIQKIDTKCLHISRNISSLQWHYHCLQMGIFMSLKITGTGYKYLRP